MAFLFHKSGDPARDRSLRVSVAPELGAGSAREARGWGRSGTGQVEGEPRR